MLVLYYSINDLVKKVIQKSVYHAKNTKDDKGNPMLNEISVGAEDESFVKGSMKEAAIKLFNLFEPYTRTLADLETPLEGFEWDVNYDSIEHRLVFRIVETATMPVSILKLLENAVESGLVNYSTGQFLIHNKYDGSTYLALWESNLEEVLGYINKRSGLKRTYKLY